MHFWKNGGVLYNPNMAQRRMFSPTIVGSDIFLDMSTATRELYFQLGMYADDDGFISPRKIMRMIGASDDDLRTLIIKNFVIPFESGVIVIRHWKENNQIRWDRYHATTFSNEKAKLFEDDRGVYTLEKTGNILAKVRQPDGNQVATEVRLGKVSINNVNGTKEEGRKNNERKTALHELPNLERDREEINLIADDIVAILGDQHSRPFYTLVAMKIPESIIRQKLAELKQGGAHSPAKAFTSAMKTYATTTVQRREMSVLTSATQAMFRV